MDLVQAVKLAQENNSEAIAFLYEETYQKSYYVALKYMKNEQDAFDVVQDAYIKAFNSITQLGEPEKFSSWVGTIVAHKALDAKKKKSPTFFSETEDEESGTDISDSFEDDRVDVSPELAMDQKETSRLVNEMISDLTDEQRFCITMFYMEDMSVKEIAEVLGVSENTVKSRLNYGRNKIKDKVLELEKKGTKLYGLLPFTFFLVLFKSEASACEVAVPEVASIISAVNTETGYASASVANNGLKNVVTKSGIKIAGKTISTKVAAIASAALIGAGGIGTAVALNNNSRTTDLIKFSIYIDFDRNDEYTALFHLVKDDMNALFFSKESASYVAEYNLIIENYVNESEHIYAKSFDNHIYLTTDVNDSGNGEFSIWDASQFNSYVEGIDMRAFSVEQYNIADFDDQKTVGEDYYSTQSIAYTLYNTGFDYSSWVDLTTLGTKGMTQEEAFNYSVQHQDEWIKLIAATNETLSDRVVSKESDKIASIEKDNVEMLSDKEDEVESVISGSWTNDIPGEHVGYYFDISFDDNTFSLGDMSGIIEPVAANKYKLICKESSNGGIYNDEAGIITVNKNNDGTITVKWDDGGKEILRKIKPYSYDSSSEEDTNAYKPSESLIGTYRVEKGYNADITIIFTTETSGEIYENGNHGTFNLIDAERDGTYNFKFDNGEKFIGWIDDCGDNTLVYWYNMMRRYGSTEDVSHNYIMIKD